MCCPPDRGRNNLQNARSSQSHLPGKEIAIFIHKMGGDHATQPPLQGTCSLLMCSFEDHVARDKMHGSPKRQGAATGRLGTQTWRRADRHAWFLLSVGAGINMAGFIHHTAGAQHPCELPPQKALPFSLGKIFPSVLHVAVLLSVTVTALSVGPVLHVVGHRSG